MNKRIEELKTQAWDYACSHIPPNALGQKNHEDYFAEKFAELIVQECLWQIVKDGQVPQDIQVLIGERFKEHFGIES
jgi:hypothetical protein